MKTYKLKYTIFSRKFVSEVKAESEQHAKMILRDSLKIVDIKEHDKDIEYLKNVFGMK